MCFSNLFPELAEALINVRDDIEVPSERHNELRKLIKPQLQVLDSSESAIAGAANLLFPSQVTPDELLNLSQYFPFHLGVGDDINNFVGALWSYIIDDWPEEIRAQFMFSVFAKGHNAFSYLEYLAKVFTKICLSQKDMMLWFQRAYQLVKNDLIQNGFWGCVDSYTKNFPNEAFSLAQSWIEQIPQESDQIVLSRIIGILHDIKTDEYLNSRRYPFEQKISSAGRPEWRTCYILSWLQQIPNKEFNVDIYDTLKEIANQGMAEANAWRNLLCSIVRHRKDLWSKAYADLKTPSSNAICRYLTGRAAVDGYKADSEETISRKEWETLFISLLPFDLTQEGGLVLLLEELLHEISEKAPDHLHVFLPLIANSGRDSWLSLIESDASRKIEWIFRNLSVRQSLTTDLCLGHNRFERKTGLWLLRMEPAISLDTSIVLLASQKCAELLFYEVQRTLILDGAIIAHIHSALCARDMNNNPSFKDELRTEIKLQALNSHDYRTTLKTLLPPDSLFLTILDEVEGEYTTLQDALQSPALQMDAPGYLQAEGMARIKIARETDKFSREKSVFLKMAKNVQILYAKTWRHFSENNGLSNASGLHKFEHSFEVPMQEFINPEGMILRRYNASQSIQELETGVECNDR